jgi:hypothetical protein
MSEQHEGISTVTRPIDEEIGSHAHPTCRTCGEHPDDYVSLADFRKMMRLTRLQTTIPITGAY